MRNIAELNVLLRARVELPFGLNLATDEFQEGWSLVLKVGAQKLEKKIRACGWSCIRITDAVLRSGVGSTSAEAVAGALKLALRSTSEHFHAVEVGHIELTQYPWFFLARVHVYPYLLQQGAILPVPDDAIELTVPLRHKRLDRNSPALYPHFASAMPELKQMLTSVQALEIKAQ